MSKSSIEWTEVTWNPVTGCDKISPGCKFCYAKTLAHRLKAMGLSNYKNEFELTLQRRMLGLADAPQVIQEAFERGDVSLTLASRVSAMPASLREQLIAEIAEGS